MNNKQVHLEMIQGVINRLSHNSFLLKGWTVVLVSALITLGAKEKEALLVCLAYFPAIAFWSLDAYFLWQERLFRQLYDFVRQLPDEDIDYSMDIRQADIRGITLNTVFFSNTLNLFHGVILASIILVMWVTF